MPNRDYDLRSSVTNYEGTDISDDVLIFQAFVGGRRYSIELLTLVVLMGSNNSQFVLMKTDGVIEIPQEISPQSGTTLVSIRVPGPWHFNGTEDGEERFFLRPLDGDTYSILHTYIAYSEE